MMWTLVVEGWQQELTSPKWQKLILENAVITVKASNAIYRNVFYLITVQYAVRQKVTQMMCFSIQINTINSFYIVYGVFHVADVYTGVSVRSCHRRRLKQLLKCMAEIGRRLSLIRCSGVSTTWSLTFTVRTSRTVNAKLWRNLFDLSAMTYIVG